MERAHDLIRVSAAGHSCRVTQEQKVVAVCDCGEFKAEGADAVPVLDQVHRHLRAVLRDSIITDDSPGHP